MAEPSAQLNQNIDEPDIVKDVIVAPDIAQDVVFVLCFFASLIMFDFMLVRSILYVVFKLFLGLKLLFVMLFELKRKFIGINQILQSVELVFKILCIKAFRFLGDEICGKITGSFSTKRK
jgi:hypothetical protein